MSSTYGTVSLPVEDEQRVERKSWSRTLLLVSVIGVIGFVAVAFGTGQQMVASEVDKTITETPDCQCISECYAAGADPSKGGTWCYSDPKISPCMDASRKVTYGKAWARCRITYGDDDCAGNPCKNQAFCVDGYDSFKCVCRNGWSGSDCTTQVLTEYTVSIATAAAADAATKNAIFVQFTGTDGDTTKEHLLSLHGIGKFEREEGKCPDFSTSNKGYVQMTVTAQDVGELHKVTYRVGGDDSFKPALLRVEYKGTTYAAVGKLSASESAAPVSATVVKARKYKLKIKAIDDPQWAATKDDVSIQLTGKNWQVTGEVVALPGGLKDGTECTLNIFGADVGTPAKVTYWISGKDSFLPTVVTIDDRYNAQITKGNRCIVTMDGGKALTKPLFLGDSDKGRGYAYKDEKCTKDKKTDGCTGYAGCRSCVLWDPVTKKDEVLCPWALPYTDGRYIIVDLVDKMHNSECTIGADPVVTNAAAVPDACKKGKKLASGKSCALKCAEGYGISGKQPSCLHGVFNKGSLKCTLTVCEAAACTGTSSTLKGGMEYCKKDDKMCCDTKDSLASISGYTCTTKPCWSKGKTCPGQCKVLALDAIANANDIPAACKKDEVIQSGHKCKLTCKNGYVLSGDQPSCSGGTFSKGTIKCAKKVDAKCTAGAQITEAGKCTCKDNADGAKDKYCISNVIYPLCAKTDASAAEAAACACPSSDKKKAAKCDAGKKCTAGANANTVGTCSA